jgi:uracil-DNA glycosylase
MLRGGWENGFEIDIAATTPIPPFWGDWLHNEIRQPYFKNLCDKIKESHEGLEELKTIFPPKDLVFQSFITPAMPRVVILGQDPYINEGEAMGLSFSVPKTQKRPPSLLNVFKELVRDENIPNFKTLPAHGDLTSWALQGVMLLNVALTTREGKSGSHLSLGWKTFAQHAIEYINVNSNGTVFMLWGNFAAEFAKHIDAKKHLVLISGHPSPLNTGKPFIGCNHFSLCNQYLTQHNVKPIRWESVID